MIASQNQLCAPPALLDTLRLRPGAKVGLA